MFHLWHFFDVKLLPFPCLSWKSHDSVSCCSCAFWFILLLCPHVSLLALQFLLCVFPSQWFFRSFPHPSFSFLTPPVLHPIVSVSAYLVFVLPQVLVSSFPQPLSSSVLVRLVVPVFLPESPPVFPALPWFLLCLTVTFLYFFIFHVGSCLLLLFHPGMFLLFVPLVWSLIFFTLLLLPLCF